MDVTSTINQLLKTVDVMRNDVQQIHSRINLLERSINDVRNQQLRKKVNINIEISVLNFNTKTSMNESKIMELRYPNWWPFTEISPTWFIFMILWPFAAQRIMQAIQRKKWSLWMIVIVHPNIRKNNNNNNRNNYNNTNMTEKTINILESWRILHLCICSRDDTSMDRSFI